MNNLITFIVGAVAPIRRIAARGGELGASLVEYALLLALIAVVAIVALHFLGGAVSNTLNSVGSSINTP